MLKKNKKENKTKLEHKLWLARENPEPVFDLSDCGLRNVPSGVYSLCRVFLKESLRLEHNILSSLSGGGALKDLHLLKILDIHDNAFTTIPDEISLLVNMQEFYLNDNQIKKLPLSVTSLQKLKILDVSKNHLKNLPENLGNLINLRTFNAMGNSHITYLPKSICKAQRIQEIRVDTLNFIYPPSAVVEQGTEFIMKYICDDIGISYVPPDSLDDVPITAQGKNESDVYDENFKAKIWKLEKIKEQKVQEFLEIERNKEMHQQQEIELANAVKANRERLLTDLAKQQIKFDKKLMKIQQIKDTERFKLIEQLHEVEQNADIAIKLLLSLSNEPLIQLLEQEKKEEERILAAATKYSETLRKTDILTAMQNLLEQETCKFKQYDESRAETTRSILEQELQTDGHLSNILKHYDSQKADLVSQLQEDVELQKVVVGALLERGDARSWGLVQQVRLVESQLAALTVIELDRLKLKMDEHLTDLAEKRANLSLLLMDLLEQQSIRRAQLLNTLKAMEESYFTAEDFWLRQYQQLLDRMPSDLTETQKHLNPALSQALLMAGVLHCLPFLAHLVQNEDKLEYLTEDDINKAGVTNCEDRKRIMEALQFFLKERNMYLGLQETAASAPCIEEASAPPPEQYQNSTECIICMDNECEVVFVPCGHLCCCVNCSNPVMECPLCRATIERKIRVYN